MDAKQKDRILKAYFAERDRLIAMFGVKPWQIVNDSEEQLTRFIHALVYPKSPATLRQLRGVRTKWLRPRAE